MQNSDDEFGAIKLRGLMRHFAADLRDLGRACVAGFQQACVKMRSLRRPSQRLAKGPS